MKYKAIHIDFDLINDEIGKWSRKGWQHMTYTVDPDDPRYAYLIFGKEITSSVGRFLSVADSYELRPSS